jgi:hypothetical protein
MGMLPGGAPEPPRQLTAGGQSGEAEEKPADSAGAGSKPSDSVRPIQEAELLEEFERLGKNEWS